MNTNKKQLSTVHFKSLISLKLDNSEAEEEFYKMREISLRRFNPYVTLFTMLIAIINTAYQICIRDKMIARNETWAYVCLVISFSVTGVSFICFIISVFVKKPSVQMMINCINYVLITPSLFQIRCILVAMNEADNNVCYSIFVLEFFIRTIWLFTLLILYSEAIFLNILILVYVIVIYPLITQSHTIDNYNLPYNFFMFLHIFISYFYTLQVTKNFSSSFNVKKKNKWFLNILENMESGFVYLKNGCIDYINYSMLEKILRNKDIFKIVKQAEINRNQNNCINNSSCERQNLINFKIGENIKTEAIMNVIDDVGTSEKIMDILLSDLDCNSISFDYIPQILKTIKIFDINKVEEISKKGFTSKLFFEEFKKKFYCDIKNLEEENNQIHGHDSNTKEKQTFVLLGHKELEIDVETDEGEIKKESLNFEVHCRFYVNSASKHTENIEIIFKDVTMTKIVEQKNIEFKLKSLVLSKIAHEFKNPLICITELIDQVDDDMNEELKKSRGRQNSSSSFFKTLINSSLPMIKSLSNYLLILVKNLDYFSQTQSGKANDSEIRETNLKEVLDFSTQISKGLIKKSNKQNDVEFIVMKDPNVPIQIYSDEIKLKQILINLLSNAIKFTYKGFIKLQVSIDEKKNLLKFEVHDTGPGMNNETKKNLFKPFKKSNEKSNMNGAGLGLSIVQDLTRQIGGILDFKSKYGEGTTFWVTIPSCRASNQQAIKCQSSKIINNVISGQDNHRRTSFQEFSSKLSVNYINKYSSKLINKHSNQSINSYVGSINDSESINNNNHNIDDYEINNLNICKSDFVLKSKFESDIRALLLNTNEINLIVESFRDKEVFPEINSSEQVLLNIQNTSNDNMQVNFKQITNESKINYDQSNNYYINQQYFLNSTITTDNNNSKIFVNEPRNEELNFNPFHNFNPNHNSNMKYEIVVTSPITNSIPNDKSVVKSDNIEDTEEALIFIIADDEPLSRQSTIRNFKKAAVNMNKQIFIIESQDGIETLNLVYKSIRNKQKIAGIITDESMKILNGSSFAEVIVKLFNIKIDFPMFLVSAYDDKSTINNVNLFNEVFSKPLIISSAEKMIIFSQNYLV